MCLVFLRHQMLILVLSELFHVEYVENMLICTFKLIDLHWETFSSTCISNIDTRKELQCLDIFMIQFRRKLMLSVLSIFL